jgi:hypothetical protein
MLFNFKSNLIHSSGPFFWAILLGHSSGPFFWAILLGHSSGPFFWAVLLGGFSIVLHDAHTQKAVWRNRGHMPWREVQA